jgi:hypothetical protein
MKTIVIEGVEVCYTDTFANKVATTKDLEGVCVSLIGRSFGKYVASGKDRSAWKSHYKLNLVKDGSALNVEVVLYPPKNRVIMGLPGETPNIPNPELLVKPKDAGNFPHLKIRS